MIGMIFILISRILAKGVCLQTKFFFWVMFITFFVGWVLCNFLQVGKLENKEKGVGVF
jgi:hypothetical protein